jgi:hypothetical protein
MFVYRKDAKTNALQWMVNVIAEKAWVIVSQDKDVCLRENWKINLNVLLSVRQKER